MICAISGKSPKNPALSLKSKCIFEKTLLEQYVATSAKDPITNETMTMEDIIELANTPQQVSMINALNSSTLNSNYSIPNLLSTLQNEWDAVMLENFKVRKQLDLFTKQLSTAMYERDAAKLVAAKLLREKEDLASELSRLTSHIASSESSDSTISEPLYGLSKDTNKESSVLPIPKEFLERIITESQQFVQLSKTNQDKYKLSGSQKLVDNIKKWDIVPSSGLSVIMNSDNGNTFKKAILHSRTINIIVNPDLIKSIDGEFIDNIKYCYSTTDDKVLLYTDDRHQITIYNTETKAAQKVELTDVEDIILLRNHHQIANDYFLWADSQGKIGLTSMDLKKTYIITEKSDEVTNYHSADLHKDGLLLALINDREVLITDITKPSETRITFQMGKEIPDDNSTIKKVQFSTNGYWMLVATEKNVMVFDLRKDPGTLAIEPFNTSEFEFWDTDPSQKYMLTLANSKITIHTFKKATKKWEAPTGSNNQFTFPEQTTDVTSFYVLCSNGKLTLIMKTKTDISICSTV
ncbi:hypothetical protein TPHA_0F00240 [Tetrapisispora phaffii CBS 4417]|uniref:Pre-mRNA-processing factor 19 n=1 Tax=Tetrapisispora phaffii (strain ATCC 24235 / CBS 4417 / NBRC 1672 / NRRL Y-8282 / UCD 70-5) TaxID=1071381 RepID=G8BUS9_TETPH|nr:hypothetical protein TPHA_0F00240 [Tetrapisispora phaffii CBS 4417]CCE63511.1 hypothetical protein TPHA_0F00240 [Tetrapisispora phaffii CBS 4417]